MKEDVIAANLANLRQSISELKECIEKQNVTVSKSEQSVKWNLMKRPFILELPKVSVLAGMKPCL